MQLVEKRRRRLNIARVRRTLGGISLSVIVIIARNRAQREYNFPVFEVKMKISAYCIGRGCHDPGASSHGAAEKNQMILASHRDCLLEISYDNWRCRQAEDSGERRP